MTQFLIDTISAVFRPSVAALAIVAGIAIMTIEGSSGPSSIQSVKLDVSLCENALRSVCQAFTF